MIQEKVGVPSDIREHIDRSGHWILIGKLAAGLVHEINNPLDGVINCIRTVRSGKLSLKKRQEYLALAEEELFRVANLTRRLLVLGRDRPLKPTPTDLNELVEKAMFFVDYRASLRGIRMEQKPGRLAGTVRVDHPSILQVIVNLLLNAIDSMPRGGMLTVRTSSDRCWSRISVSDTGRGIPPADLPRVFEPFFSTKQTDAAGLGLSICQSIAEQHSGEIGVVSTPGNGSTFTIKLPLS
jgi:signal transduction histidine kinase